MGAAGNDSIFGGSGSDILTDGDNTTETSDSSAASSAPRARDRRRGVPGHERRERSTFPRRTSTSSTGGTGRRPVRQRPARQLAGGHAGDVAGENEHIVGHPRVVLRAQATNACSRAMTPTSATCSLGAPATTSSTAAEATTSSSAATALTSSRVAPGDIMNPGGRIGSSNATATTIVSDGADTVDGGTEGSDTTGDNSAVAAIHDQITYSGRSDNLTLDLTHDGLGGCRGERLVSRASRT